MGNDGRDGVTPSENRSAVGRVDGIASESPREGRDLNGARSMRALPWGMNGRDGVSLGSPHLNPIFMRFLHQNHRNHFPFL